MWIIMNDQSSSKLRRYSKGYIKLKKAAKKWTNPHLRPRKFMSFEDERTSWKGKRIKRWFVSYGSKLNGRRVNAIAAKMCSASTNSMVVWRSSIPQIQPKGCRHHRQGGRTNMPNMPNGFGCGCLFWKCLSLVSWDTFWLVIRVSVRLHFRSQFTSSLFFKRSVVLDDFSSVRKIGSMPLSSTWFTYSFCFAGGFGGSGGSHCLHPSVWGLLAQSWGLIVTFLFPGTVKMCQDGMKMANSGSKVACIKVCHGLEKKQIHTQQLYTLKRIATLSHKSNAQKDVWPDHLAQRCARMCWGASRDLAESPCERPKGGGLFSVFWGNVVISHHKGSLLTNQHDRMLQGYWTPFMCHGPLANPGVRCNTIHRSSLGAWGRVPEASDNHPKLKHIVY